MTVKMKAFHVLHTIIILSILRKIDDFPEKMECYSVSTERLLCEICPLENKNNHPYCYVSCYADLRTLVHIKRYIYGFSTRTTTECETK